MTEIAILTEDLTRNFGPVCAVDELSLTVPAGNSFGVLRPTGGCSSRAPSLDGVRWDEARGT